MLCWNIHYLLLKKFFLQLPVSSFLESIILNNGALSETRLIKRFAT
jgi:hypothetical protein